jgi:hypothetical protein
MCRPGGFYSMGWAGLINERMDEIQRTFLEFQWGEARPVLEHSLWM